MSYRRERAPRPGLGAGEGLGAYIVFLGALGVGAVALSGVVAGVKSKSWKIGGATSAGALAGAVAAFGAMSLMEQRRAAAQSATMMATMAAQTQAREAGLAAARPATLRTDVPTTCQPGVTRVDCYTCPPGTTSRFRPSDRSIVCVGPGVPY